MNELFMLIRVTFWPTGADELQHTLMRWFWHHGPSLGDGFFCRGTHVLVDSHAGRPSRARLVCRMQQTPMMAYGRSQDRLLIRSWWQMFIFQITFSSVIKISDRYGRDNKNESATERDMNQRNTTCLFVCLLLLEPAYQKEVDRISTASSTP